MDIFLLEIEKFGDSASVIEQRQYNLIKRIFCKLLEPFDFCFRELIPAAFIGVLIFELDNVHKLRIKDILKGLFTRGSSLNKAGKLAVLNSKVLDDQDVTSLAYYKELEDILQFIDD